MSIRFFFALLLGTAILLAVTCFSFASDTPGLLILDTRRQPPSEIEGSARVWFFTNVFNPDIWPNDWKVKKVQIVRLDDNPARIFIFKVQDDSVVMVSGGELADRQEFTYPDYVFLPAGYQFKIETTGDAKFLVYIWYSLWD